MKYAKILVIFLLGITMLTSCKSDVLEKLKSEGYNEVIDTKLSIDNVDTAYIKGIDTANPLSGEIFCADPTAVEYEGRLYVYGTNDHQQYDAVGDDGTNTYDKIKSFVIFSTDDMINWTYHGIIDTGAISPWIINSWAPSVVSRTEDDGLTHFYLYYSNSGCGVGVLTATNPLGPWTDPLGKPLVNYDTEGLKGCPNPFDPGVCIDDNGIGWISFGGGRAPDGSEYMPDVARIAKLGADMISFDSGFTKISAPYFFEASELNYINGTYVYTYNTSWEKRLTWDITTAQSPSACSMAYMTTTTPLDSDSWVYRGDYFKNPGESGLDYSNNHTHLQKFQGKYYLFHHTMLKQSGMTTRGGFRSIGVVEIQVDESTLEITRTGADKAGVLQIKCVDALKRNEGETLFTSVGITFTTSSDGLVNGITSTENGANTVTKSVQFGKGIQAVSVNAAGSGRIEFRLDAPDGECCAAIELDNAEMSGYCAELSRNVTEEHDVYIVFSQSGITLDYWQFA